MKTLHQLFAAVVLTLIIAVSSSAGNMHTTSPTPPPEPAPATAEGETSTPVNGNMHTTNSDEATAGDAVVAGALGLLQSVLSLL